MKKRDDLKSQLVEKFELLTKQEIKNYNDTLESTRKSIVELKYQLENTVELYAQQVTQILSQHKAILEEHRDMKHTVERLGEELRAKAHDFSEIEKTKMQEDWALSQELASIRKEVAELKKNDNLLFSQQKSMDQDLDLEIQQIYNFIEKRYENSISDNHLLKTQILSIPSEAKAVKEELDEQIVYLKELMNSLGKNMNIMRTEFEYERKKIEECYNMAERLVRKDRQ